MAAGPGPMSDIGKDARKKIPIVPAPFSGKMYFIYILRLLAPWGEICECRFRVFFVVF